MATSVIKWNEGEGNIVATYTGSGNAPISLASDVANEGLDREQLVIIRTTKGNNPKEESVLVKQPGLREEYITSDTEVYMTADNEIYGCLKQ